jgi:hypothetical protein
MMSQTLDDALVVMTSTYLPLDLVVRGMVLDAKEVADALAKADPDTVEHNALQTLAAYFPVAESKVEPTE